MRYASFYGFLRWVRGAAERLQRSPAVVAHRTMTRRSARRRTADLGIGIITHKRLAALQGCVEAVQRYTTSPYGLVIADDGSDDGSVEWAREQGLVVITGQRGWCAWNKNRALYHLMERTDCDPILLLEDDCWPVEPGWEQAWIEAAEQWGHVNFQYWTPDPEKVSGSGSPEEPYRSGALTGQCTVTTRQALEAVGYLDTRFVGWGHEHTEWTLRLARHLRDRWGPPEHTFPMICSGLRLAPFGTWRDGTGEAQKDETRNERLMADLAGEPIWRPAWRDSREEAKLREEQAAALGAGRPRQPTEPCADR
jgi:hypothetical protein